MKILLIDHLLAHYRRDVYKLLLESNSADFEFVSGDVYNGVKSIDLNEVEQSFVYKYCSFKVASHNFFYSGGIVRHFLRSKPQIVICTGIDFHLPHTALIFLIHRIVLRRKFYWWTHATYGNQGRIGIQIRKFFYKYSSGVLAYSNNGKENMVKIGIKPEHVKVVNNSLNKEDYGYLKYDVINRPVSNPLNILYSGRLTALKRVDFLLQGISKIVNDGIHDVHCTIVGEGELQKLKNLAIDLNIADKVEFVGAKYGCDVEPYFLQSDIFVYPSGIGLSIVHALSYGIPVITTDDLNLHFPEFELLEPMVNGALYIDGDIESLVKTILDWRNLILQNPKTIRQGCIQSIINHQYLPEALAQNILSFIL